MGSGTERARDAFSEAPLRGVMRSIRTAAGLKLIQDATLNRFRLYDLRDDPAERDERSGRDARVEDELKQRLAHRVAANASRADRSREDSTGSIVVDGSLRRRLEALGYIAGRRPRRSGTCRNVRLPHRRTLLSHAAPEESRDRDSRNRSRAGAAADSRTPGERQPEEEGGQRAQTATKASRIGTPALDRRLDAQPGSFGGRGRRFGPGSRSRRSSERDPIGSPGIPFICRSRCCNSAWGCGQTAHGSWGRLFRPLP